MWRNLGRAFLICTLCLPPIFADELPTPPASSSELDRLEQIVTRAQEAKQLGQFEPERYAEFLVQFRETLRQTWSLSPRKPPDTAAYARIQVRLGDSAQAMDALGPALKNDPENVNLRLTLGEVNFENKDYPAALAEANAILEREPGNKRAQALKQFSQGRTAGVATAGPSPLQIGPAETASSIGDPRIVEAGRRATARMNAIHFADKAMARLKIEDPREALRYATLAEASDPTLPDASMQQGLAYIGMKEPKKAVGRFGRAEELWRAQGHQLADTARIMKERAIADMEARPQAPETQSASASDSRRTTWPLKGAGAGLLLSGAIVFLLHKEEIERWSKAITAGAIIGAGILSGGLAGYALYALAAPALTLGAGGTLALAGGGTMTAAAVEGGAVVAILAGGAAGGAAGAKAAKNVAQESQPQKRESPFPNGRPEQNPGPNPFPAPIPISDGFETQPKDCAIGTGEDVLSRFVDGTRLAPGFLDKHEGTPGGHTIDLHVSKPVAFLLNRLDKLEASSSYYDKPTAEAAIRAAVMPKLDRIRDWMKGKKVGKLPLSYQGAKNIGYGVTLEKPLPQNKTGALTVLLLKNDCSLVVLTSYPE